MKRRYLDLMTVGQLEKLASSLRMILEGWDVSIEHRGQGTFRVHLVCSPNIPRISGPDINKIMAFTNRRGLVFNIFVFNGFPTVAIF